MRPWGHVRIDRLKKQKTELRDARGGYDFLCGLAVLRHCLGAGGAANPSAAPSAVDLVEQRLIDSLSREMLATFNLFIYVDKAERGPFAQRMFVFEKTGDDLALLYDWPVSTGRETWNATRTATCNLPSRLSVTMNSIRNACSKTTFLRNGTKRCLRNVLRLETERS